MRTRGQDHPTLLLNIVFFPWIDYFSGLKEQQGHPDATLSSTNGEESDEHQYVL